MAVQRKPKIPTNKRKIMPLIEMETAISRLFGVREHIIVPNISWGFYGIHEMDVCVVRKSGYMIEIEIKRSVHDMKADFKKKHEHKDTGNRIAELYYAIPIKLLEKCITLIPEDAGIITCHKYNNKLSRAHIERRAKRIKNCRKLTIKEQFTIARLGTMRIWSSKEKIIKLSK